MKREAVLSYGQIIASMLVGALALAYVQFLWLASHDFFLVPKAEAEARRVREETYNRIMVSPINEFEGLD
jgi:hypothetical protein